MSETTEGQLIGEQFKHTVDLLRLEQAALRSDQAHDRELVEARLARLERCAEDFEERIRLATEGVTQFKLWFILATSGIGLAALAALLKIYGG